MSYDASIETKDYFKTTSKNVAANAANESKTSFGEKTLQDLPKGADKIEQPDGSIRNVQPESLPRSIASPYNLIRLKTIDGTEYPMIDEDTKQHNFFKSVTARELVNTPRGASIFSVKDFTSLPYYGIIPNNRLLTLRRFAYPVFDDIFSKESQSEPDIARALAYSSQETNRLNDILSFSCGVRWKELKSAVEQNSMIGSQNGVSGFVGGALKLIDPTFGKQALQGANRLNYDPLHDQNKVYGPVDSIDSMHIRDVGLNFEQEFTIKFEYDLKSLNGQNQKAVMMDIMSNMLLLTTNDAKFWGGARYWVGPRPSKYMHDLKYLAPDSFEQFLHGATTQFKSFIGTYGGPGGAKNAKETLKKIASNAFNLGFGKLLNSIGRPGIPVANSLLTGNPTGEWHLTVGNPLNPILCAGDLILTNSNFVFNDELGFDDFPTRLTVELTLQHNKPRGRAEIESMFNAGKGRMYFKPENLVSASSNKPKATANEPHLVSDAIGNAVDTIFGDYDHAAVKRNASAVWSFIKDA